MTITQTDRVLAALRAHRHGITQVDFLLPDVIDGGTPITRVGARIRELRAAGHRIESGGRRDKCVTYKLTSSLGDRDTANGGAGTGLVGRASSEALPGPTAAEARLFDPAGLTPPAGPYDQLDDAA